MSPLVPSLLGVTLGMRHALEPDHLAAVSALAGEERGGVLASARLGVSWGLGHSLSLLIVGGGLAIVDAEVPEAAQDALELAVAVMVVGLGLRAVRTAWREGTAGRAHTHAHGGLTHTHAAPPAHLHVRRWTLATRPLLIGLVHGLAGSGALTALVLAELPTTAARLGYIALFGGGSVLGMGLLTGLAGAPMTRLARAPRLASALLFVTGLVSTGIGAWWGLGSAQHLWAR